MNASVNFKFIEQLSHLSRHKNRADLPLHCASLARGSHRCKRRNQT